MQQTITTGEAVNDLLRDEYAGWTLAGARALVDYLEELEADLGSIDFDPVGLRCEFGEYATTEEALYEYGLDSVEKLEDITTVIFTETGGLIVQAF